MRALVIALTLALGGCSVLGSDFGSSPAQYVPPSPPSLDAQLKGIAKAAEEEKLVGALEMSEPRTSDFGPGRWTICLLGSNPSRRAYYTVFFDDDHYKGVRLSVIDENCERQSFRSTGPLPPLGQPEAAKSATAK